MMRFVLQGSALVLHCLFDVCVCVGVNGRLEKVVGCMLNVGYLIWMGMGMGMGIEVFVILLKKCFLVFFLRGSRALDGWDGDGMT